MNPKLLLLALFSFFIFAFLQAQPLTQAQDCIIPESGPWPPCATGGATTPPQIPNCPIPPSGPWPPCATRGEPATGGNPTPNNPQSETTGSVVGTGTAASCTQQALQQALNTGGKISFNCGWQPTTITLTTPLHITQDTTLDGASKITLDGAKTTGLLTSDRYLTLTLQNLTLQNGWTNDQGGALNLGYFSTLTVKNSTFINNRAFKDTQICDGGGALFIGGGSQADIHNSTFINNHAQNGGAINNLRSRLTVTDSIFRDNTAIHSHRINTLGGDCGGGGAIYIDGTRKPEHGGPDKIILTGNEYINNSTNNQGGALFLAVRSREHSLISDSLFRDNKATVSSTNINSGNGGGLWYGPGIGGVGGHNLVIRDTIFDGNSSQYQGGGIWLRKGNIQIYDSAFTNNRAFNPAIQKNDDFHRGIGGGIAVADNAFVQLNHTTITDNFAAFVGGGIVAGGDGWVSASNTHIANNSTDWTLQLQINCNKRLINRGGNTQYLAGSDQADQVRRSNCGNSIPIRQPI